MKPGYYLSETGNFQIWYPKDAFVKGEQRFDVVGRIYDDVSVKQYSYEHYLVDLIECSLEFEFIGEL
jgi:hypothetical protein